MNMNVCVYMYVCVNEYVCVFIHTYELELEFFIDTPPSSETSELFCTVRFCTSVLSVHGAMEQFIDTPPSSAT